MVCVSLYLITVFQQVIRLNKCTRYSLRVNSKRANNYKEEDVTQSILMVSPVVFTSPFGESEAPVISLISTLFRNCGNCESICLSCYISILLLIQKQIQLYKQIKAKMKYS